MDLTLITDLNESRMYRSKQSIKQVSARQVADHAFMDMIALWILYNEFEFAPSALNYASSTVTYNRFSNYRQSSTDLYMNLHILSEKRSDLLGTEADATLLGRVTVDVPNIIRFLRQLASNNLEKGRVRMTLQRLEQSLYIDNSNYRSIRRLAQSWPTLDTNSKRTVLTRMLMFYRMHARRSEMFGLLNTLAKAKNLENPSAKNPELSTKAKVAAAAATGAAGAAAGWRLGKSVV